MKCPLRGLKIARELLEGASTWMSDRLLPITISSRWMARHPTLLSMVRNQSGAVSRLRGALLVAPRRTDYMTIIGTRWHVR